MTNPGLYVTQQFSGCDLHFPHKDWASEEEKQNYLAIERWALHFRTHCLPTFAAAPPVLTYLKAYGLWDLSYASTVDTLTGYQPTGIVYDNGTELGDPNPAHDQYEFYLPPGTYRAIADFDFTELGSTTPTAPVTRNMYIRTYDYTTLAIIATFPISGTGTQDSTHLHLDVTFTTTVQWILRIWVNFNGISSGTTAHNKWGSPDYTAYSIQVTSA